MKKALIEYVKELGYKKQKDYWSLRIKSRKMIIEFIKRAAQTVSNDPEFQKL